MTCRYQKGVMNLVDQAQCKLLYSVLHPKPAHFGEVGRGEVGSEGGRPSSNLTSLFWDVWSLVFSTLEVLWYQEVQHSQSGVI